MADSINILVPKESIDSIIQADAAITKLDIVYRKMLTTIEQGRKVMSESAMTQENLNEAAKKVKKTSEELDAASKKLKASEEALANFDKEKYAQTVRNTEALKSQQKEILQMVQAEKQLTGTIEKAEASTKALTAERKKLDLETVEGKKRLQEINTTIDKNTQLIRENSDAATKQRMNIGNYKSALEGLPGPIGQNIRVINNFSNTLNTLNTTNNNVSNTTNIVTKSLNLLSKVPVVLAIVAIVSAFAGLVKIFKSTEEGGDAIGRIMKQLSGVMNVLKQAAQSVSLALADLFSGKFGQAADHLKEGFSGIGGRMRDAAKSGKELYDALDDVGSEKLAYNIDAVREKIAQLRTEAAETADDKERARLLREAIKLTDEMYSKEIDWSKRTADATLKDLSVKYGKSAEELKKFTLLSYEERNKVSANDSKLADFANKLNDEGLAELQKTITEETRLRTDFAMETLRLRKTITSSEETANREAAASYAKRIADQRKAFEEDMKLQSEAIAQMAEEDKNTLIDNHKKALADIATARDGELTEINNAYVSGTISFEKAEQKKLEIARKYELLILQENLKALEGATGTMTPGAQAEAAAKIADMKLKIAENLAKDEYDNKKYWDDLAMADLEADEKAIDEMRKDREKKEKEAEERKRDLIQGTSDLISELGNALFELNDARIEEDIAGIERKRDAEIEAAGDSKEKQAEINAKYDKLVAAEKTKQAKNDRNAALFNIAINTAVAIMKAMTQDPTGILAAIAAGIGLVQAGVVLAKPLPTYAKGTRGQYNTPSKFVAGEAGTEWVEKITGEIAEVTRPTVFTNAKGMRVYSNREIQQLDGLVSGGKGGFDTLELREIRKGIDSMARSLAGQRQYLMQDGRAIGYKQDGYTRKYLERMRG